MLDLTITVRFQCWISRARLDFNVGSNEHGSSMVRLEKPLPPFHDILVFAGDRELQESRSTVEVELQTLATPSPAKALASKRP